MDLKLEISGLLLILIKCRGGECMAKISIDAFIRVLNKNKDIVEINPKTKIKNVDGLQGELDKRVQNDTYNAGQSAQDAKISANATAIGSTSEFKNAKVSDTIGSWNGKYPNDTVESAVTSTKNSVKDNTSKIGDTSQLLTKDNVQNIGSTIGKWKDNYPNSTIAQKVSEHETHITDLNTKDSDLESKINSNTKAIETERNRATAAEQANTEEITRVKNEADSTNLVIGDWSGNFSDSTIASEVKAVKDAMSGVSGGYVPTSTFNQNKEIWDKKIADNESNITTVTGRVDNLETNLNTTNTNVSQVENVANNARNTAISNSNTIGSWGTDHPSQTISAAVTNNENSIAVENANRTSADNALSARIDTASTNITNINQNVSNLQNGLSTTNEAVTGLQNRATSLETRVTAVEEKNIAQDNIIGDWSKNHSGNIDEAITKLTNDKADISSGGKLYVSATQPAGLTSNDLWFQTT